jgi:DNA recombination protein RmuC
MTEILLILVLALLGAVLACCAFLLGRLGSLETSMKADLNRMADQNERQLDRMRQTVDERLQKSLEARLGESFAQVARQLEQVQAGLGEMRTLAVGVGDLKKVLANVKNRGVFGELQLGALLEDLLAPGQYAANVAVRPGRGEVVEFAVKLPGGGDRSRGESPLWLPIDAKFPREDYERLQVAFDAGDAVGQKEARTALEARIRSFAKDICEKYVEPPYTTDFALLFLPFEGLYAEVLRIPGLFDRLQREWRVTVVGPTTLAAFLSSLQMGFRTLGIQKRSGEVWQLLSAVKHEFGLFGELLDKTRKKLQEATTTLDDAGVRTRKIERSLKKVEESPPGMSTLEEL